MIEDHKSTFSSKLGFLASAASAAVGIGNIWRFPYLVGKYGGASFVLLYLLCVFILGFPLMLAKLALGRNKAGGTYKAYSSYKSFFWKMPGLGAAIVACFVLSFYPIVTGWLLGYFLKLSNGSLLQVGNFGQFFSGFVSDTNQVMIYTSLSLIIVAIIVISGVNKGIELVSKILMPIFVVLMVGLIMYALSLDGSKKGLLFYLVPNLEMITPEALYAALGQSFASLAIGAGISITYGAYVGKKEDLINSTFVIVMSDTMVALLAGMIIFPLIFHIGITPTEGPALIFVSLPYVFKSLGMTMGPIIGGSFFMLLVFAAITSAISIMEVPVVYLMEKYKLSRTKSVIIVSIVTFLFGIPSQLSQGASEYFTKFWTHRGVTRGVLDIVDLISLDIIMPVVAVLFSLTVIKKWRLNNLYQEINLKENRLSSFIRTYLKLTIQYISPIAISLIVLLKLKELFG